MNKATVITTQPTGGIRRVSADNYVILYPFFVLSTVAVGISNLADVGIDCGAERTAIFGGRSKMRRGNN